MVALHAMPPEPPRRAGESAMQYERRLPEYPSGAPAQFAVEVAGGRLAQLGVAGRDAGWSSMPPRWRSARAESQRARGVVRSRWIPL